MAETPPSPARSVPGPKGIPLFGVIPNLLRDPFGYLMATASRYDGLARIAIGPFHIYLVSHPDYVRRILVENSANYYKGKIMDGIRIALGRGLFTADGDLWKRQRRLMTPVFHRRHILQMLDTMTEVADQHLGTWSAPASRGQPVDVLRELILLNIDLILKTLFGATISGSDATIMLAATQGVFQGMSKRVWTFFVPPGVPLPGQTAYRAAIERLDSIVLRLIDERRRSTESHDDLLGLLLSVRDEATGEGMSDDQLRDEIFTIFLAGYESTATGLSWTLYLLSQDQEADTKLRNEVDAVLGGRRPTLEDTSRLVYTRMVIDEALRLYPSFPMYFRTTLAADTLGPYIVPGGASIVLSPYATHHNPVHWENPERFDPERFAPGRLEASVRHAYYPFGQGERLCIGRDFSLTEATAVLAMIVQRYDRVLAQWARIEPHYAMTLTARYGVPLVLQPRPLVHD